MSTPPNPEITPSDRLTSLGRACALGLGVAVLVGLLTAYRTAAAGGSVFDGLLIGTAMALLVVVPLLWMKDAAGRGWRLLLGDRRNADVLPGLALWIGLSVLLLLALATLLKLKTHHRGLGGATFGVFGAAGVVAAAAFTRRVQAWGTSLQARGLSPLVLRGAAIALVVAPLVVLLAAVVGANSVQRAVLIDLVLVTALLALALWRPLPSAIGAALKQTAPKMVAIALAALLAVAGLARAEWSQAAVAVKAGGGLPAALLSGLELWSDRDGDGAGAHFGGGDCDEGDPRRGPSAAEIPGDGVDSDCDGIDGLLPDGARVAAIAPTAAPTTASAQPGSASASTAKPAAATAVATAVASASGSASATAAAPPVSPGLTVDNPAPPPRLLDKPDIILVTLDSVRADRTSAYGYAKNTTPHLKKLAERGVLFERCYAPGSTTQRALMPLASGLPLSKTEHSRREWPRLKEEADTLAERLKRGGYQNGAVTSFTWLRKDRGFNQGFDEFDESPFREYHPERKVTGALAAKRVTAMYERMSQQDKPMFLWLHLFDPHSMYLSHKGIELGGSGSNSDLYDGEIAFADTQLGRLVDKVNAGERAKRTVWIVHGSHGEAFGEHGKKGHGPDVYDEMVRVPLVIVVPQTTPSRYAQDAVSTLDIAATVLDLAALPVANLGGVSLRAQAQGVSGFQRAPVTAYARDRMALVDWPWKLMVFKRRGKKDRLLLFDLSKDPAEKHDVSADHSEQLRRLDKLRRTFD